ncbi:FAD/FMN-containing dehydrogenase [Geosmithia morbida]|uniref:FAD/FMN-containing dehydrogenase n=1 Tax=Geosmithia morbida TaxID=1094350 RepID=A0A9P4YTB5_9HYPO|nr:FAD/FMN-containing dehydrogenase [Geosmithia morbida]KAF4122723.1 FAD/FMN-containing dehydrogenase [Geosmithia morbida]
MPCLKSSGAVLWTVVLLATSALASPSEATQNACDDLSTALGDRVSQPLTIDYIAERQTYWSTLLRDVKPACIVFPQTAQDVSVAVNVLNDYPDVQFAVKSGGHEPNPRHSSIEDGVLISMSDMVGTTYDADKQLAYVKPGGTWNDVIGTLDEQGVAILGGRLGIVGVAGLLLQGGLSFLGAQHGMAADVSEDTLPGESSKLTITAQNIVEWETVTANGDIVNVNADSDPELAVAMRGSGNQFGIVTQFTAKTYPMGQVWGGTRTYSDSKADELFAALHNFVPENQDDTKAAIIMTTLITLGGTRSFLMFYFYQAPEPPVDGPFAAFLDIVPLTDGTGTRSYADLTFTLPYTSDDPGRYREIADKYRDIVTPFLSSLQTAVQCSIDFQPFPAVIGRNSATHGGNALGLTASDPDRIVLEIQCSWLAATDDDDGLSHVQEMTEWLETKLPEWRADEDEYLPLLMNDATFDQNVTQMYRDYAQLKDLQAQIDPDGFWSTRAGGWTY